MTKNQRTKLEAEHDLLVIMLYEWENKGEVTNYPFSIWYHNYTGSINWENHLPNLYRIRLSTFLSRISAMKKAIKDIQKQLYEN